MAKQTKKIQHKLQPQKEKKSVQEKKPGKDYVLLFVILLTLIVAATGWMQLDNLNRAMYIMLAISLSMTYLQRHAKLAENRMKIIHHVGIVTMIAAVLLFGLNIYHQYFGK